MKKYYADKKSLNFLRVVTLLLLVSIILGIKYLLYKMQSKYPELFESVNTAAVPEVIGWIFIGVLITAYVVFFAIILPMWYRSVCYTVSEELITLRSEVLFRNTIYVKISAIQYTTSISMPFSKYTSFNFLLINAYGGRLIMMFLSLSDLAETDKKIQQYIKSRGGL